MATRKISDKPLIPQFEEGDYLVLIKGDTGYVRLIDPSVIAQRVWTGDAEKFAHLEEIDEDAYYYVTGDVFAAGLADVTNLSVHDVMIFAGAASHEITVGDLPSLDDEECESTEAFAYVSGAVGEHHTADGGSVTALTAEEMSETTTITNIYMEVDD